MTVETVESIPCAWKPPLIIHYEKSRASYAIIGIIDQRAVWARKQTHAQRVTKQMTSSTVRDKRPKKNDERGLHSGVKQTINNGQRYTGAAGIEASAKQKEKPYSFRGKYGLLYSPRDDKLSFFFLIFRRSVARIFDL